MNYRSKNYSLIKEKIINSGLSPILIKSNKKREGKLFYLFNTKSIIKEKRKKSFFLKKNLKIQNKNILLKNNMNFQAFTKIIINSSLKTKNLKSLNSKIFSFEKNGFKFYSKNDLIKINKNLKQFYDKFYLFLKLKMKNNIDFFKDFIKLYIMKMKIRNKKFKILFLNPKFIKKVIEKKKLKYLLNIFLYFKINEILLKSTKKNNLKIKKNSFDNEFYKEILIFFDFLKTKLVKKITTLKKKIYFFNKKKKISCK